jgi:peptidoglycan hydrolase-like protein with peptidoglycan-binding domain
LARCIDGLGAAPQAQADLHLQRIDAAQAALLGVREGVCIERRDDGWLAAWHDGRADVRQVQRALSAQVPALAPGFVDGRYGPDTRTAVADFQRRHGLPATGEADALTQLLLLAAPTPEHGSPHVRR